MGAVGGLERVSATTLLTPARNLILEVYSVIYDSCLHCRGVHGSVVLLMAKVRGLWSV